MATNSEAAKKIIQSERRKLSRASSQTAAKRLDLARNALALAESKLESAAEIANDEAIYHGLSSLIRATESTWGVTAPINMSVDSYGRGLTASTDFKSISIDYPQTFLPKRAGDFNVDALSSFICDVKGIAYHEIGHIRFTVPFPVLWDTALPGTSPDGALHRAWNILEDQRMELAVVNDSPDIAGYFTTMMMNHMLRLTDNARGMMQSDEEELWVLTVGRTYLPFDIRREFRKKFVNKWGLAVAAQLHDIVNNYCTSTDPNEMINAVVELDRLLRDTLGISPAGPDHHGYGARADKPSTSADPAGATQKVLEKLQMSASDSGSLSSETNDSGSDGSSDEMSGQNGGAGDGSDNDTQKSMGENQQVSQPSGESLADRMKREAEALKKKMLDDASVQETVRKINEYANTRQSSLRTNRNVQPLSESRVEEANELAISMIKTLEYYTADKAPLWTTRQTRGILDPFSYRTKSAGSQEYRRMFNDAGDQSIDIAVSVLLDTSGSMSGTEESLGVVAYACKRACEALGIPCTVVTFDDCARVVWDTNDSSEPIALLSGGGTNPEGACEALVEQSYGKSNHLVLVMTDGAFNSGFPGFPMYSDMGRYFVGFQYGNYGYYSNQDPPISQYKPQEAYQIRDLMDIPRFLTGFLAAYIR